MARRPRPRPRRVRRSRGESGEEFIVPLVLMEIYLIEMG